MYVVCVCLSLRMCAFMSPLTYWHRFVLIPKSHNNFEDTRIYTEDFVLFALILSDYCRIMDEYDCVATGKLKLRTDSDSSKKKKKKKNKKKDQEKLERAVKKFSEDTDSGTRTVTPSTTTTTLTKAEMAFKKGQEKMVSFWLECNLIASDCPWNCTRTCILITRTFPVHSTEGAKNLVEGITNP